MKRRSSVILGYVFSLACVALSLTLVRQRYSYPGDEVLLYEIKKGTRVVVDLGNGHVYERRRPGKEIKPPAAENDSAGLSVPKGPPLEEATPEAPAPPVAAPPLAVPAGPVPEAPSSPEKNAPDYRKDGTPVIAVLVKGLGMSASTTEQALNIKEDVTLGFSPYSPYLNDWVKNALDKGRDVMLHLPMEAGDFGTHDPGPYSLLVRLPMEDNLRRLSVVLSRTVRYAGVYTDQDERFTSVLGSAAPILQELKKRDIDLVYGGGYERYSFIQLAEKMGYPIVAADVHVNSVADRDKALAQFDDAVASAQEKGYAVVMTSPYPVTIRLLEQWINGLSPEKAKIVPVSYLLAKKREATAPPEEAAEEEKTAP
jgi:polysaccharide deacetylase 2 family uncharacterized protein YibQ